jgi:hypothetical protein
MFLFLDPIVKPGSQQVLSKHVGVKSLAGGGVQDDGGKKHFGEGSVASLTQSCLTVE